MPEQPPAARRVGKGSIIGMLIKEMTIVAARGCKSSSGGGSHTHGKVDLNEIPARTESAGGAIRNKEEAISGGSDGSEERRAGGMKSGSRGVISRDDGDGGSDRNGSMRGGDVSRGGGAGSCSVLEIKDGRVTVG